MNIKIGNKEYTIEYSFKAALYGDCAQSVMEVMTLMDAGGNGKDGLVDLIKGMTNLPEKVVTMFYAGLMQNHGTGKNGDGSVPDIDTAEELLCQYIHENKDNESVDNASFYGMFASVLDQMGEDDFFKLIGLDKLMEPETPKKRATKKTADHKQKVTPIQQ